MRSYSSALKDGLEHCVLLEQHTGIQLCVHTDYNDIGKLQYLARTRELTELDTVYADRVEMILLVPSAQIDRIGQEIADQTAGKAVLEQQGEIRYGMADGKVILL